MNKGHWLFIHLFFCLCQCGFAQVSIRLGMPKGHSGSVYTATFSLDGKYLVTGGSDNTARLWHLDSGKEIYEWKHEFPVVKLHIDENYVAISCVTALYIWDLSDGELIDTFNFNCRISDLKAVNRVGQVLVGLETGQLHSLDLKTLKLSKPIKAHGAPVYILSFSDSLFVTTSLAHDIKIWDLKEFNTVYESAYLDNQPTSADFDNSGNKLTVSTMSGSTYLLDCREMSISDSIKSFLDFKNLLSVHPNNRHIIRTVYGGLVIININDLNRFKLLLLADTIPNTGVIQNPKFIVSDFKVVDDGKKMLTLSGYGDVKLWDLSSNLIIREWHVSDNAVALGHNASCDFLAFPYNSVPTVLNIHQGDIEKSLKSGLGHIYSMDLNKANGNLSIANGALSLLILDTKSGDLRLSTEISQDSIKTVRVNYELGLSVAISYDGEVIVSNLNTHDIISRTDGPKSHCKGIFFDTMREMVILDYANGSVLIWDANMNIVALYIKEEKRRRRDWKRGIDRKQGFISYDDENGLLSRVIGNRLELWSLGATKRKWKFKNVRPKDYFQFDTLMTPDGYPYASQKKESFTSVHFVNSDWILTTSRDRTSLHDARRGRIIRQEKEELEIRGSSLSQDGSKVVIYTPYTMIVRETHSLKRVSTMYVSRTFVKKVGFCNDDKMVYAITQSNHIVFFEVVSGRTIGLLDGHSGLISDISFDASNLYAYTSSHDGSAIKWDLSTGQILWRQFIFINDETMTLLPNGYYKSTKGATKELYYIGPNNEIITFDQLDVKYNRPDKVLKALGNTDTALITAYERAYEKRVKRLGVDTTAFTDGFSFPELDIVNENEIDYQVEDRWLQIHLKGRDSSVLLDRFNVWVNESPIFGQKGYGIKDRNWHSLDTTLSIELSRGENQIEASITNTNGIESFRKPLYVNYHRPEAKEARLYFIGIGIDSFQQEGHSLSYGVKDIRDLAEGFKEQYGAHCIIDTLFNRRVTINNIKMLKEKLYETTVDDKVVIAYSGHGLISDSYDYYLSTYTIDFTQPERDGLPYEMLDELLDSIPARQKLMLLDACHSGEIDKESYQQIQLVMEADSSLKGKGLSILRDHAKPKLGMDNSFALMQELFLNVRKGTGATVISAANGNQFAYEKNGLENGVFTYCILHLMESEESITVQKLKQAVEKRVAKLTQGKQQPTSRLETNVVDWEVW